MTRKNCHCEKRRDEAIPSNLAQRDRNPLFQIEPGPISTADKIKLIEALAETGLHHIQAASFGSPHIAPNWADAEDVVAGFTPKESVHDAALWFNAKGLNRALAFQQTDDHRLGNLCKSGLPRIAI